MPLKGKSPEEVSTINVTPLVDVMLVLLIIFMVITPLLQHDVTVDMYHSRNAQDMDAANRTNAVVLAITRDGKVFLGRNEISPDSVTTQVENRIEHNLDKTVFLRSDARAKYGDVLTVVNGIRAANIQDLALITQQIERRPGVPANAAASTASP
jgi:biopolymer transport protein ExbD